MAIFTLKEARDLLPQVKEVTQHYYDVVEEMREQLENIEESSDIKRIEGLMNDAVGEWVEAVRNLGVEVKGLWLADFDSGDGYYYCWKLGEDDIEHFHSYDGGFAGPPAHFVAGVRLVGPDRGADSIPENQQTSRLTPG